MPAAPARNVRPKPGPSARVILALLIPLAGVVVACGSNPTEPNGTAACPSGPLFSASLLPLEDLDHIVPLGNLNPPAHTLPTGHTYWNLSTTGGTAVDVRTPGDMKITGIERTTSTSGAQPDFGIEFIVCSEVLGSLAHLADLTPSLSDLLEGASQCENYSTGTETVDKCRWSTEMDVEAGTVLGSVGQLANTPGVDFGLTDQRRTTEMVNPERAEGLRHAVCPLDYYDAALRTQLESRLGTSGVVRTTEPRCGRVGFGVPGTAAGNWYAVDGSGFLDNYALALVADNVWPESVAFSIGLLGTSQDERVLYFEGGAGSAGNPPFEDVAADGTLHCYDQLTLSRDLSGAPLTDVIVLLQLRSDGTLRFEPQAGAACGGGPWVFTGGEVVLER